VTLNDRFHFVPHVIRFQFGLLVPMVEKDGEKGIEGRGSVRAVTCASTASSPGTCVAER